MEKDTNRLKSAMDKTRLLFKQQLEIQSILAKGEIGIDEYSLLINRIGSIEKDMIVILDSIKDINKNYSKSTQGTNEYKLFFSAQSIIQFLEKFSIVNTGLKIIISNLEIKSKGGSYGILKYMKDQRKLKEAISSRTEFGSYLNTARSSLDTL